jgi:hypothetical protein
MYGQTIQREATIMYRVTFSMDLSAQWIRKHPELLNTIVQQRIYRWGSRWGVMKEGKWSVEERFPRDDLGSPEYPLVEECRPCGEFAPPKDVEDLWEEEVISINGGEYTGVLTAIVGNQEEMESFCREYDLPVASLPVASLPVASLPVASLPVASLPVASLPVASTPLPTSTKKTLHSNTQRRCFIVDE